jgi:transcriptional regulator with XRE-family HTH domain
MLTPYTVSGMDPGRLLREARERHGLSQRRLALRAGTSQDAISRIERGIESPTLDRFQDLLLVMGERWSGDTAPLLPAADRAKLAASEAMSPSERLRESASWNLVATKLEIAGARTRGAGELPARQGHGRGV